ncbi:hypothetical protein KR093_003185 [Drosophila rubida]|uniref:Sm domain-containing protein n=1 Tax=Drosophila rubida TaxID=30044 RepID=A0AAD4PLX7_9MUSC|nr:hypothetical protein KR093_003185 [Drosophila rubida]
MSTEQPPAESAENESKFKPMIFTNQPDEETDVKLSPGRRNLKKWLGRMVRVTLKNKLTLIGIFSCTDHDQNLVIAHCDTFLPDDMTALSYGNVMVPGNEIVAFEVEMQQETATPDEKKTN